MHQLLHRYHCGATDSASLIASNGAMVHHGGMSQGDLLSAPQVARALGVARSTITRRVRRGELQPAAYVGNRALFLAGDVDAIKRGEQTITKEPEK